MGRVHTQHDVHQVYDQIECLVPLESPSRVLVIFCQTLTLVCHSVSRMKLTHVRLERSAA